MLSPAKLIDLECGPRLSEARRVFFLTILTHTEFKDCTFFREQLRSVVKQLECSQPIVISLQLLQCNIDSIE
jgi:hypothetical protein